MSQMSNEEEIQQKEEDIKNLIKNGDSYTALERCQMIVRKLKRQNKLEEGLIFLMRIALILADQGEWHSAAVCAYRSISQFPSRSTTIRIILKHLYLQFANMATPEAACYELFEFYSRLGSLFDNEKEKLLEKQLALAETTNFFRYAQSFYLQLLSRYLSNPAQEGNEDKINQLIENYSAMLWRWIQNQESKEMSIKMSQFIFCRAILLVLGNRGENVFTITATLNDLIQTSIPDEFESDVIFKLPLFNFIQFFLKAVEQKSLETIDYLIKQYQPILDVDPEMMDHVNQAKEAQVTGGNQGLGGLGSMLQNLLGGMFGNGE
ncbi:hypothetical protein TRFO_21987 [Tritrichomonas foetus]|uniref:Uncharacterized protein n=1 Tax=Tritrichomonas foetus TaxID=1144522 RepID=A0A1J4KHD7_9EUKA|nr:hypothetical protein TRFO_21987 [Tritrichomonas foetus]|eukprot:OHT09236.1 hypothetical protein TRFO_21987 [Tritrichomonas foetus]